MSANLVRLVLRPGVVQAGHRTFATSTALQTTGNIQLPAAERDKIYPKLGNRDVVGFGFNGNPNYMDREEFPYPAVRFKENTSAILALREKEKGDWKQLSQEDKKTLYRSSYCQTFAEMKAPSGEWKSIIAGILLGLSVTGWMMIWMKKLVYPPVPGTITREWQEAQLEMMIKQGQGRIEGISSEFDYENNKWK